jgi:hypothetical protein
VLLFKTGKYTKKQTTRTTDGSGTLWSVLNGREGARTQSDEKQAVKAETQKGDATAKKEKY